MVKDYLTKTWQEILAQLETKVSKPSFDTWLKSTSLSSIENNQLTVVVPNDFAQDWLKSTILQ